MLSLRTFLASLLLLVAAISCRTEPPATVSDRTPITFSIDSVFDFATRQYAKLIDTDKDTTRIPYSGNADGSWERVKTDDWMSGFLGGVLWYIYEYNRQDYWKQAAHYWTLPLTREQYLTKHHDIGFMIGSTFGNGLRLTGNEEYRPILLQAARTAISRFNPNVGTIKSWNTKDPREHLTIIDNMMNLELLTWAFKQTGDSVFYNVAVRHSDVTMANHFRPDYTSYHVLVYDSASGGLINKITAQGYSDSSMWARGHAWGIYGYSMMYRETGLERYLDMAQRLADVFIQRLPADGVPYWDFDAPQAPPTTKDASAGAIAASALLEMSTTAKTDELKLKYYNAAVTMLNALSTDQYLAVGQNYQCVLLHSGYNVAKDYMSDVNMTFADYYYLEALHRLKALNAK